MQQSLLQEIILPMPAATLGFELLVFLGSIYFRKHNITFLVLLFLSSRILFLFLNFSQAHAYIALFSPIVFAILVSLKKDYLSTKRLIPACLVVISYILLGIFTKDSTFISYLHSLKFINQTYVYSDFSFCLFLVLMLYVVILRKINNFECFLQGAYVASYFQFLFYHKLQSYNLSYFELGSFIFLAAIGYQGYKLAFYDSLTNVYNRRAYDTLELKNKDVIAVVDIDFFKKINDTYGHDIGDIILRSLAGILKKYAKTYRYGGEEFCLVFKDYDYFKCVAELEKLRKEVEDFTFNAKNHNLKLTISIGLCLVTNSKFGAFEMADNRLYQAKLTGRNKVVFE